MNDLHIVIAAVGGRHNKALLGHAAVSAPLSFAAAQDKYAKLAAFRSPYSHVLHYAVRSIDDPRWAGLVSEGFTNKRNATKAWAKEHGYVGKPGGWIYRPNGESVCQGWDSLADTLVRQLKLAKGSDERWYVLDRELVA
jgi:hypothetical protein